LWNRYQIPLPVLPAIADQNPESTAAGVGGCDESRIQQKHQISCKHLAGELPHAGPECDEPTDLQKVLLSKRGFS
jgi:hypothetical protein